MANVKEVEWQGGIYNIADEVARGEAQQARTLANTAQTTANTAQTTADTAKTTADTAQTTADTAQTTADAAQTTANAAQTAFSNSQALAVQYRNFGSTGRATFARRGLVTEFFLYDPNCIAGEYNVPIPEGFAPITGTGEGGIPITWGSSIKGYCVTTEGILHININESGAIGFSHLFLM